MRLRLRVGLATVAAIVPVMSVVTWARLHERESLLQEAIKDFGLARIQEEREQCEASAETWPGELPAPSKAASERDPAQRRLALIRRGAPNGPLAARIQVYAYDDQLTSRNPKAPALSEGLKAAMASGQTSAEERRFDVNGHREILLRTAWGNGPCAFVLARMPARSSSIVQTFFPTQVLFPVTLVALTSVLLAIGPIVRRVRRLTKEVRDSAKGNYRNTITVRGEDEIGELARAFVDAGNQIRSQMARQEQRERALRTFLENTTHDVMTPLTVLHGHLATFQQRAANGEYLSASSITPAMNEAHYMASLVHNLAMAAMLEAGEPRLQSEPVNMNEVVERTVSRHAPIARQHAVSLDRAVPESPVWARGDVTLIEQAVSNVILNAVRYNREGGHVAVLLERIGSARFLLRVIDDGPGIPEEERSKLVERHFRGNVARSRDPGGHGLGLNITFRVTQVHGWQLELSKPEPSGLQVEIEGATCDPPAGFRET